MNLFWNSCLSCKRIFPLFCKLMHDKYTISIAATNISTYIHQNTIPVIKKSLWQYDVIFFSINEQIALHLIMPFELSSFGGESKSFSLNLEMHRAKYDAPGFLECFFPQAMSHLNTSTRLSHENSYLHLAFSSTESDKNSFSKLEAFTFT